MKVIDHLFSDHYCGNPMDTTAIFVVPDENFDDWVVRDESGHELGHYPTREAAELVARPVARHRGGELIIRLPDGRTTREMFTTR
jgi:hypothetical protein